jgi:hypothetical protein
MYSIVAYVLLLPLKLWIAGIGISILIGWLGGILNDILTQLRRMNGEKFPELDAEIEEQNKPDELIKG